MGNLKNKNNNKKKLVGNARERENEIRVNIRVVCEERSNMLFFFCSKIYTTNILDMNS